MFLSLIPLIFFLCVLKFYILSISNAYDMLRRDVTRKFILTQNKIFCLIDVAFITLYEIEQRNFFFVTGSMINKYDVTI